MNKKKNKSVVLVLSLSLSVRLFLMERTKLLNSIPASQLSTFSVPPFCSAIPEADSSRSSSPSSPRFGIPKLLSQLLLVSVETFFFFFFPNENCFPGNRIPWKRTELLFVVLICGGICWFLCLELRKLYDSGPGVLLCCCVRVMDLFPVFANSSLLVCVIHLRIFANISFAFCTFGMLLNFVDLRIFQ
jgi:hypothetical protein